MSEVAPTLNGVDRRPLGHTESPYDRAEKYQKALNESWPLRDRKTGLPHARGIDDVPADEQIKVQVRLVCEPDGEVWLNGTAKRWTRTHVYVGLYDERLQIYGI